MTKFLIFLFGFIVGISSRLTIEFQTWAPTLLIVTILIILLIIWGLNKIFEYLSPIKYNEYPRIK